MRQLRSYRHLGVLLLGTILCAPIARHAAAQPATPVAEATVVRESGSRPAFLTSKRSVIRSDERSVARRATAPGRPYRQRPAAIQDPVITSITSAADHGSSALAPCSLFSVLGDNLATQTASATTIPLPTQLGGTTVLFNGLPVPLLYASEGLVNGQIPCDAPGGENAVVVQTATGASMASMVDIASGAVAIFHYGDETCIATGTSYQLLTRQRPAPPGSVFSIFLTGLGQVDPAVPTGEAAAAIPSSLATAPFEARVGDRAASILFLGATPGLIGVGQANLRLPLSPASGWLAMRIVPRAGGVQGNCLLPVGSVPLGAPGPVVKAVTPQDAAAGEQVTIQGANFVDGASVSFGTALAASVTVLSATMIQAAAPEGAGLVGVTVRNPDGQQATLASAFTYVMPGTTLIGPAGGAVAGDGDARLVIPPGALSEERLITLQTHQNESTLPGPLLGFLGGATLAPSGAAFDVPVTLTLPLNTALEPGTEFPVYAFDPVDGSWTQTEFRAIVAPDGQSASAEITHFSTFVIMDTILHLPEIFDQLARDAGHVPYEQLFEDYRSRVNLMFQQASKKLGSFRGGPVRCYEVVGVDPVISYAVTEVATAGERPNQIEGGTLWSEPQGREGTIKLEYDYEHEVRISTTDPNATFPGDTEHTLRANVNVWISCGAPDLVLTADRTELDAVMNEATGVTAQLVCGGERFAGQGIRFKISGTGSIGTPSGTTGEDGTVVTAVTAQTNQTCTSDSAVITAECEICQGEPEQATLSTSVGIPTIFTLNGKWHAVEVADETGCGEGVNTYGRDVTLTEDGDRFTGQFGGGYVSGTRNGCAISGFGGEREDEGTTYAGGSGSVAPSGRSIAASAGWTWRGPDGETCGGSSDFKVTR